VYVFVIVVVVVVVGTWCGLLSHGDWGRKSHVFRRSGTRGER
jgi:hypothetical protein